MEQLIVFDFHGTLSLKPGKEKLKSDELIKLDNGYSTLDFNKELKFPKILNIKTSLRIYKRDSWYQAMKDTNIDPYLLMPTLDQVISFTEQMSSNSSFGVASMGEDENFIYDLLRYCFESKNVKNPFSFESIAANNSQKESRIKSESIDDKTPLISVIIDRLYKERKLPKTVFLIDDTGRVIDYMKDKLCAIYVEDDYFTINDWNRGCAE